MAKPCKTKRGLSGGEPLASRCKVGLKLIIGRDVRIMTRRSSSVVF